MVKAEKATFGAGCFWGVEELFRQLKGVLETSVGYCGGSLVNPTYEDVSKGSTGHAEVVQVVFDSEKISYSELLLVFWNNHNSTTLNRQGSDVGTQYRSAIFYHNDFQEKEALKMKETLMREEAFSSPIVTEITKVSDFYPAEGYHQKYLMKRGQSHCHI